MPVVKLSLEAIDNLRVLCVQYNYAAMDKQNRGISSLLTACQTHNITWQDKRPEYAIDSDNIADEVNHARIWSNGSPRMLIRLGQLPIQYLFAIGQQYKIKPIGLQRPMITGNRLHMPAHIGEVDHTYSTVNAVIEAIGLGWLTPSERLPLSKALRFRKRFLSISDVMR